ncbi:uncharacterized protein LOC117664045 [Pantherophis guttatus]|uniref:ribonuclease H n=1 Tax=Pantherophis guttatus TaxID=94885 RepID=A0A6P9BRK3_PANGU|nr:uncharacterized protein LOC117664045 [Pantherophis guttatus]
MGGGGSTPLTPLACMLKHFKDAYISQDYGIRWSRQRLRTFCEVDWPELRVGWPAAGSLDLGIVLQVHQRVFHPTTGHPDQAPYIDVWLTLVQHPPIWLQKCKAARCRLLVSRTLPYKKEKTIPTILPSCPEELPNPPPYLPRGEGDISQRASTSLSGSTGEGADTFLRAMDDLGIPDSPGVPTPIDRSAQTSLDGSDKGARPKERQTQKSEQITPSSDELEGAVGGQKSPLGKQEGPIADRTRSKDTRQSEEADSSEDGPALLSPLRRVDQSVVEPNREPVIVSVFQHVPFTSSDLLNWKMHYGPFCNKPAEVTDLIKTIVDTHNPTWRDLQQLMSTIFNPEEREKIRNAALKILKGTMPARDMTIERWVARNFPSEDPRWDPYKIEDLRSLQDYQRLVVQAIQVAGKPTTNMSKPSLVIQGASEAPEAFYARLLDAYRMYTPIDPTQPENARMLAMAFISQSAPDIRRKLQKLEGALGKSMSELMEVARKVFANRDKIEEQKQEQKMHKKAELLAAALMSGPATRDGPRLGRLMALHEIVANSGWEDFNVPSLWAEDNPPGFASHQTPIIVEELPAKHPIRLRQRAYPRHIMQAIQEVIDLYLAHNILVPTESAWNTPILPIPKGDGRFRPVQNLKPVNAATVTIHPLVPNPYVILGLIPQTASWFSVIDLKDAFFTIPVHKKSQHLFAFEWENPATGRKQQYTWTRLPQGFKNSPTLFGNALAADLEALNLPMPEVLLQYVDDLLVTGQTKDICWQNTYDLLHLLQRLGYKASRKKAQLVLQKVRYLGYDIEPGKRTLGHERKEAICRLPTPRTKRDLRGFLGAAGFCRIWIPNFSLLAKPLYEATRGSDREPLLWRKEEQKSFSSLKHALMQAPSLGLPDLDKPFQLFVDTKHNVAVGVLTQRLGTWHRPVAYLSKQLDPVARGWPACLKAVAGTALLTQESSKLTFGQELEIQTPHALKAVLETKGHLWLTNPRMLKYQGLITHNPMIVLKQSTSLNPATLLPEPDLDAAHDCIQTIGETYASRPDMSDVPLPRPAHVLYTDGTSFLLDGVRKAGYAVVTLTDIWEAEPLPPGTSAQLAELHALTRALELSKNLDVNIYTDSKYAFLTVQVHGALYKERGLITAGGKDIKYGPQILRLLDSVWAPRKVAVMHCRGHQKSPSDTQLGNHKADQEARHAALRPFNPQLHCLALWDPPESMQPHYSASELAQARELDASLQGGWWVLPDSRVFLPGHLAWDVVNQVHAHLHLGKTALAHALLRELYINKVHSIAANVCSRCHTCAANNPRTGPQPPQGHQPRGDFPFDSLMIDFTDLPRSGSYTALLVIICTYSGWPECIPTRTKRASEVTKALLQLIIPRYGLPSKISSDNGPEFIHKATHKISTMLGIHWRLHCAFHASSGSFVERVNRSIKDKLAKICQETHLKWPDALPMALLAVRCAPRKDLLVSPFELLYGRVPNLVRPSLSSETQLGDTIKLQQLQSLNRMVHKLQDYVLSSRPHLFVTPTHNISPGQEVWVKEWKREPLCPKWRGPFSVVMTSPLAIKVAEIKPWIHWSRVKVAASSDWRVDCHPEQPLRLTLRRRRTVPVAAPSGDTPEAVPLRTGAEEESPAGITPEANTHRTGNAPRFTLRSGRQVPTASP